MRSNKTSASGSRTPEARQIPTSTEQPLTELRPGEADAASDDAAPDREAVTRRTQQ